MSVENWTEKITACAVCEARKFRVLGTPGRLVGRQVFDRVHGRIGLCRCARCGFTFVNPRPARALLDEFYTSNDYRCHDANDTAGTKLKADFVLDIVDSLQPRHGRMLDYGCGGGLLLRRALQRGIDAVGFDVGWSALRTCREQGLSVVAELEDLPAGAFDSVVLHHVFEHVSDHDEALCGISRLLAKNGKVFIEVPNAASLRARLSFPLLSRHVNFDERFRAYPIHLSYFAPNTLSRLLARNGFVIERVATYGLGLDELIFDETATTEAYGEARSEVRQLRRLFGRRGREFVKRALFGAKLGENLLVVASLPAQRFAPVQATVRRLSS